MSAPAGVAARTTTVRASPIGGVSTAASSARAGSRDVELARTYRSGLHECSHYGALVIVDRDGSLLWQRGEVHRPFFPRSCAKPFQAVAMLNAGAPVGGPDLALAAASHTGENEHVVRVLDLLAAAGATEQDLRCPAELPTDGAARDAVIRAGGLPRPVYMNCSGKHAVMLGTCRAAGWPTADYLAPEHPLQRLIRSTIADLTGETCGDIVGVDGCGAPVFAIGMVSLARGFSALVSAAQGTAQRSVADAMRDHPRMVGGSDSLDTLVMTAYPGLLAKGGADGVHALALPDGRAVAFKIADGGDRARLPIITAALRFLGVETGRRPGSTTDASLPSTAVLGGGRPVGAVTVAPDLFR
jgi:L-asparaginase II